MPDNSTTLLCIKPLLYQGEKLLNEQWKEFLDSVRTTLKQSGFEDDESSEELLLFTFNHPFSAVTAIHNCLLNTKDTFSATAEDGAVPLSTILHLVKQNEISVPYKNADASFWDLLEQEELYVSRQLKSSWEVLMAKKNLPSCTLESQGEGLFHVKFSSKPQIKSEILLSFRGLPIEEGALRECFYCGMKNHKPASCPSKFLTMNTDGLGEAGYLPFEQLNMLYKQVFQNQTKYINLLSNGVTAPQLKKDPALTIYVSYFDISKVFQLRFLWNIAFSQYSKWIAVFKSDKLVIDNNNLQLGFDCIRVRQYAQAEELLTKESQSKGTKRFYATIGLALIALERGRLADMGSLLELAVNLATTEKDRIYIALMQSRYFELTNEVWKARDAIKNAHTIKSDCQEIRYRKIQLEVKGNFKEEAFYQLRSLMAGQRQFFMSVLMDPALLPIQAKVEDILSSQYYTLVNSSKNNLILAKDNISDLKMWFDKDDPQMSVNLTTLDNLLKRFERKSYFDVLDVDTQAKALISSGKKLRETKLNELYDKIEQTTTKWSGYHNFWKTYRYKGLFKKFSSQLIPLKNELIKAKDLVKKSNCTAYKEAVSILDDTLIALKKIESTFKRMNIISSMVSCSVDYGKKLIITEIVVALAGLLLSAGLGIVPDGTIMSDFANLFTDPWFQKKAIIFVSVIMSPIIALSWTMMSLSNK